MNSHTQMDNLIGKSFEGVVGEPWDFVSAVGDNRICGKVIDVLDRESHLGPSILCKVSEFYDGGAPIDQVVAVNRYCSTVDWTSELLEGKEATVNMMFARDGHRLSEEEILNNLDDEMYTFITARIQLK